MIERSCVDIDRGLEVVCSSLIDIEFSVLNGEDIYEIVFQDIVKQFFLEVQKVLCIVDIFILKGNKFYLYIFVLLFCE